MTALAFVLAATALLTLRHGHVNQVVSGAVLGEMAGLATFCIGLVATVGFVYELRGLSDIFLFSTVAVHTAVCFVALGIGVLCARPDRGLMKLFSGSLVGSKFARRFIVATVLVPLIFGATLLPLTEAGLAQGRSAIALNATATAVALTSLLLMVSAAMKSFTSTVLSSVRSGVHPAGHRAALGPHFAAKIGEQSSDVPFAELQT